MSIDHLEGRWIRFDTPAAKTSRWLVVNKSDDAVLGVVSWFGRWRRYAFQPESDIVLQNQCLMDIADFCVDQTTAHMMNSKKVDSVVG
jgi:hypothetical protein